MTNLIISCDTCAWQESDHCHDCVVSFLCEPPVTTALVLDLQESRALRMLADAGLVPGLAHQSVS